MLRWTKVFLNRFVLPILVALTIYMTLLFSRLFQRQPPSIVTFSGLSASNDLASSTETMALATPEARQPDFSIQLPKLSPSEFRQYNKIANEMGRYHDRFRTSWQDMYTACEANKRPPGLSIRQFVALGDHFCSELTAHHDFEESYIFPMLARKMPRFRNQEHLKGQHKVIHAGLVVLDKYLEDCRYGVKELRLDETKRLMDTFGEVLWKHLDDEVEELQPEHMRQFWTIKEIEAMPFGS